MTSTGFFEQRRQRLLELTTQAMGKDVVEPMLPSAPDGYDLEEDDPVDEEVEESVA